MFFFKFLLIKEIVDTKKGYHKKIDRVNWKLYNKQAWYDGDGNIDIKEGNFVD